MEMNKVVQMLSSQLIDEELKNKEHVNRINGLNVIPPSNILETKFLASMGDHVVDAIANSIEVAVTGEPS